MYLINTTIRRKLNKQDMVNFNPIPQTGIDLSELRNPETSPLPMIPNIPGLIVALGTFAIVLVMTMLYPEAAIVQIPFILYGIIGLYLWCKEVLDHYAIINGRFNIADAVVTGRHTDIKRTRDNHGHTRIKRTCYLYFNHVLFLTDEETYDKYQDNAKAKLILIGNTVAGIIEIHESE